jgi:DNA-binding response OmpR family regulator
MPASPPRVLVADDNRDAADSLALLLRAWGYEPAVAYDGPAALALASDGPPAAALLDVILPGMDGCAVARRLREMADTERALIVALTDCGDEDTVRRCYEAGIDLLFRKPYDTAEFWRVLDSSVPARA